MGFSYLSMILMAWVVVSVPVSLALGYLIGFGAERTPQQWPTPAAMPLKRAA